MLVRFVTDAPRIGLRWHLRFAELAMNHMCAVGVSGLDLYVRENDVYRWCGAAAPERQSGNQAAIDVSAFPGSREFILYLPLYNGTEACWIGVEPGARLEPAPPWQDAGPQPVCFYGTSIVHGACAPRTGLSYPAIIGRRCHLPHLNFGFSGNAQSEPELADFLAEPDVGAYVLDPVPNMGLEWVVERIEPFVRRLREAHAQIPIILVESILFRSTPANSLDDGDGDTNRKNEALRRAFENLRSGGDANLHLVPGRDLLGDDFEGTVDGVHPTDAGFLRMAEVIGECVERIVRTAPSMPGT